MLKMSEYSVAQGDTYVSICRSIYFQEKNGCGKGGRRVRRGARKEGEGEGDFEGREKRKVERREH